MDVPPEFASLRRQTQTLPMPGTKEEPAASLAKMTGELAIKDRAGEILFTFRPGASACALELRPSVDASPFLAISYDPAKSPSSISIADKTLSLSPDRNGVSTIHLWLDGSILEVFADSREAITARNFTPTPGDIHLAWTGAPEALKSLSVSQITPISTDRLTS
jgi:hypothetical protein